MDIKSSLTKKLQKAVLQIVETNYWKWDIFDNKDKKIGTTESVCRDKKITPDELLSEHPLYQTFHQIEKETGLDVRNKEFDIYWQEALKRRAPS